MMQNLFLTILIYIHGIKSRIPLQRCSYFVTRDYQVFFKKKNYLQRLHSLVVTENAGKTSIFAFFFKLAVPIIEEMGPAVQRFASEQPGAGILARFNCPKPSPGVFQINVDLTCSLCIPDTKG